MNECRVSSRSFVLKLDVKTTPSTLQCMTHNIRQNAFLASLLLLVANENLLRAQNIYDVTKKIMRSKQLKHPCLKSLSLG